MARTRLSLVHYDLLRELCESCRRERFHFVPIGAAPAAGACRECGREGRMADLSDSSIYRLVTESSGEMVVVPLIAREPSLLRSERASQRGEAHSNRDVPLPR